jgi:hypothetical protein
MLLKVKQNNKVLQKTITYRQGDVLVVKVERLPEGANEVEFEDRVILQAGEVTGHCHAISTEYSRMYTAKGQRFIVIAPGGARLNHEEHAAIDLPQGVYRVVQQREYVPEAPPRDVID